MEWLTAIRKSIDYIETHLKEDITVQDIANQVKDLYVAIPGLITRINEHKIR